MSFLRHGESIDPMRFVPLGASGLAHSQCSSASMSSSRLFLGRLLSSRACLRFAGRERFSKTKPRRTMIFQRTATTPFTPCLSPRVRSMELLPSIVKKRKTGRKKLRKTNKFSTKNRFSLERDRSDALKTWRMIKLPASSGRQGAGETCLEVEQADPFRRDRDSHHV